MLPSALRSRIAAGDVLLGLASTYPAPGILEAMAPGWDFVWIDAQHGQFSVDTGYAMVRAAEAAGAASVLRVPTHDPGILGLYADCAPTALMAPMVNDADEARRVVDGARFPPLGRRSFGGRRPIDTYGPTYYREEQPFLLVQIETPEGLDHVEAVAAVEGVDALFIGTDDLKIGMGHPRETSDADLPGIVAAVERVAVAARNAGKACGAVAGAEERLAHMTALGYQILSTGSDVGYLRAAAPRLAQMREVVARAQR